MKIHHVLAACIADNLGIHWRTVSNVVHRRGAYKGLST